ncbi:hypothetical protein HZS_1231 [Henneguya salminicola]|nr:hypothetical protein HZS_1231 [Henneguya salminicola]
MESKFAHPYRNESSALSSRSLSSDQIYKFSRTPTTDIWFHKSRLPFLDTQTYTPSQVAFE